MTGVKSVRQMLDRQMRCGGNPRVLEGYTVRGLHVDYQRRVISEPETTPIAADLSASPSRLSGCCRPSASAGAASSPAPESRPVCWRSSCLRSGRPGWVGGMHRSDSILGPAGPPYTGKRWITKPRFYRPTCWLATRPEYVNPSQARGRPQHPPAPADQKRPAMA